MSGRHSATLARPVPSPAPDSPSPEPAPGVRRSRRLATKRSRHRRLLLALLAVVSMVVIAVPIGLLVGRHDGGPTSHRALATRTQRTLLLSLRGADGNAIESVLLAADPRTGQATGVLIPSRVIAEVPGSGSVPFGQALGLGDPALAEESAADLLGVTVDGGWVLDAAGLARLVDLVGPVPVDVAVDVVQPDAEGTSTVVIPAGPARLSGAQAVQYATYLAPGEDEIARLPRLTAVLQAVLAALPAAPQQVAARLAPARLGQLVSVQAASVSRLLATLGAAERGGNVVFQTLPSTPVEAGGAQPTYLLDSAATRRLVDRDLTASVPRSVRAGGQRVLVLSGGLTPEAGAQVRPKLVAHGLVYVGSRNAADPAERTVVLVFARTPAATALGHRVAAAIGVPQAPVQYSPRGQSVADTIVIIGADFHP